MTDRDSPHHRARNIAIVADDLTGACDSGVEFVTRSGSVLVVVASEWGTPPGAEEAIVAYNTQSRNLPREEAYGKAFEATMHALSAGADLIFKKVDSALRGQFGVEIAAVMDAARLSLAFVLPAIPEAGRETIGGIQHIGGIPVAESFYASDPEHPVSESNVLVRAEEGTDRKAGLITLEEVRTGKIAGAARRLQQQGREIIVVDARSAADMRDAVEALMEVTESGVYVGCQGLARALATQLPEVRQMPRFPEAPAGPILFVCGTPHPQSRRQLQIAAESSDVELVAVEMSCIQGNSDPNVSLKELADACQRKLLAGQNVALFTRGEPQKSSSELRRAIPAFLSNLCRHIVEAAPVTALVLTGGETAYSVCRALDVHTLKLHARVAPLVVACRAVGGPYENMVIVTKGGSIGPDDLVSRIRDFLRVRQ